MPDMLAEMYMPHESGSVEACKAWDGVPLYQLHICILQPEKKCRIHYGLRVTNRSFSALQCNVAATCAAGKLDFDATNNAKMKDHSRSIVCQQGFEELSLLYTA